jgi:hypothetical protein
MLKRYIAFVPDGHDARGGWGDILGEWPDTGRRAVGAGKVLSWDTPEEAAEAAAAMLKEGMSCDASWHVVDLHTGQEVASGDILTTSKSAP